MLQTLISYIPVPKSQVVFFSGLIVSLLFSLIDNLLVRNHSKPFLRHVFNASSGLCLVFYTYGLSGLIALLLPSLFVYLFKGLFRRNTYAAMVGWGCLFAYLLYCHLLKVSYSFRDYQVYHTASLMVLTAKLSMFISDLYNGKIPKKGSFVKFLGFCFYYPSVLGGPCIRLDDYLSCYDRDVDFEKFKTTKKAFESAKLRDGFTRIFQSILCVFVYIAGSYLFKPGFVFEAEFASYSLLRK